MSCFRVGTFAQKMILTALLASSVALCVFVFAFQWFDNTSSQSQLGEHLSALGSVVGQNSTAALNFNDRVAAVEVLRALQAERPIMYACLYDASDRLFAQYVRADLRWQCARTLPKPASKSHSSVIRPVMRHDELVGSLLLASDMQDLQRRRRSLLLVTGVLTLIGLFVSGGSAAILQRKISKPISELVGAMSNVTAKQDFETRVSVAGSDEIALIASGFNGMLAELQRRDDAKKAAEAKLQFQAFNDPLTGLPNRRFFAARLSQALALAERSNHILGLLYIDLDGFKLVNDSLGHAIGDALLLEVAGRFQTRIRHSDVLARLGGDEFTVILQWLHRKEDAAKVAKSLLDVLATPFVIEDHQLTIGASIGISIFPENARDPSELMQQADSAMYGAKRDGKNRAMYYTPELGSLVRERLNLENELRLAISRNEITVHYQPEFDVLSNHLVRFEALARWTHPTLGAITPARFIPVAEESGLIVALGALVMQQACTEATNWQALSPYPIQVAVNVSSIQFRRDGFVDEVVQILSCTGLKPELLQLELTESVMLSGIGHTLASMKRLKEVGVSLAIDDFGTGYSCLSYLPSLPFDALKIDRAFVKDLSATNDSAAMVRSLIALAKTVGMRVIVEGIETECQLQAVKDLKADEIQGFLMGRPTPDPAIQIARSTDNQVHSNVQRREPILRPELATTTKV